MHLMHSPSVVSCSQQRRPLLPPHNMQSEAFSRDVRANGAALGWEPDARKIYTAGFIESAQTHTHTHVRRGRLHVRPLPRSASSEGSPRSQLTHAWSQPSNRLLFPRRCLCDCCITGNISTIILFTLITLMRTLRVAAAVAVEGGVLSSHASAARSFQI